MPLNKNFKHFRHFSHWAIALLRKTLVVLKSKKMSIKRVKPLNYNRFFILNSRTLHRIDSCMH